LLLPFPHTRPFAFQGRTYSYVVRTMDSRGLVSKQSTCRSHVTVRGRPADLTSFTILISAVATLSGVGVAVSTGMFLWRKRDLIRESLRSRRAPDSQERSLVAERGDDVIDDINK
jgi:hypothetical protein